MLCINSYGVAELCHQVSKALWVAYGDTSRVDWELLPNWEKESATTEVDFILANPEAPVSAQHDAWVTNKLKAGWVYGINKDEENKTHPCLVPFEELPREVQAKDYICKAIVDTFRLDKKEVTSVQFLSELEQQVFSLLDNLEDDDKFTEGRMQIEQGFNTLVQAIKQRKVMMSTQTKVSQEEVKAMLSQVEYQHIVLEKSVLCLAVLKNSFGSFQLAHEFAGCVDPANFSVDIGKEISLNKAQISAENKIWELLGWELYRKLGAEADARNIQG